MKKILIALLSVILLSGCGIFDRGNYENRSGFVISDNIIINYHTNSIGEIDLFMIDEIMTFFEALVYTSFDAESLNSNEVINSYVTTEELSTCGVTFEGAIPRFLRIGYSTYFYNIRSDGYCTYDEYIFHADGYSDLVSYNTEDVSPVEVLNVLRFKSADFTINTFEDIIFIEEIKYNTTSEEWEKELVTAMPMSLSQAGDVYEENSDTILQFNILQNYVLENQSINLLNLRDDYQDPDVNNIWNDATIEALGRDHEVIKKVRLKNAGDLLTVINDTLSRLGMFQ